MRKKTKPFTRTAKHAIAARYREGASLAALAKRHGCSVEKIRRAMKFGKVKMRPVGRPIEK